MNMYLRLTRCQHPNCIKAASFVAIWCMCAAYCEAHAKERMGASAATRRVDPVSRARFTCPVCQHPVEGFRRLADSPSTGGSSSEAASAPAAAPEEASAAEGDVVGEVVDPNDEDDRNTEDADEEF